MEKSKTQQKTETKRNHHHNQHRNSLSHQKTIRPLQPQDEDKLDLPSCIMNSLYLGDCFQATNKKSIDHLKITHIVNYECVKNMENVKLKDNRQVKYLRIPIEDVHTEDIYQYFQEAHNFIEEAMFECGIVLVHCAAGVSRSSTIVISHVMKKMGLSFMFAFNMVKRRRRMIMPNEGFFNQLLEWERKLNGGKSISQFKDGYMDLLEIEQQMYSSY
ncbi:predicted protein [Naegleria gruberi]|uniref:protein-tyrosine-phosphatase n=1 Tax=Naegleria gruberi TaxID=5762 RepID=D2VCE9_NAEGR|nr:uncharacterized protein NAEGRDRAFT_33056 [Naegleria gruberi]EFC45293.1 predicted protein [Naegleria gruberi]|eukprot:XP_002678037.1 predicted protein [Naegleria gruberi strain NEG-M]